METTSNAEPQPSCSGISKRANGTCEHGIEEELSTIYESDDREEVSGDHIVEKTDNGVIQRKVFTKQPDQTEFTDVSFNFFLFIFFL